MDLFSTHCCCSG